MNNFDDQIFLACLDAIEEGQDPELVLANHPEQAESIRELLALDSQLAALPVSVPPTGAQTRSETVMLSQARAMKEVAKAAHGSRRWWRPLVAALGVLVILLSLSLGAVQVSADALPGDVLYPVKILGEGLQLRTSSPAERLIIEEEIELERVREIQELMRLGRTEPVACFGTVEAIAADHFVVYGLRVERDENTVLDESARPVNGGSRGTRARIHQRWSLLCQFGSSARD